ncbi:hypothetical protein C6A85_14510, partial [Mycobacterium sp. ITM-2017-0098]
MTRGSDSAISTARDPDIRSAPVAAVSTTDASPVANSSQVRGSDAHQGQSAQRRRNRPAHLAAVGHRAGIGCRDRGHGGAAD